MEKSLLPHLIIQITQATYQIWGIFGIYANTICQPSVRRGPVCSTHPLHKYDDSLTFSDFISVRTRAQSMETMAKKEALFVGNCVIRKSAMSSEPSIQDQILIKNLIGWPTSIHPILKVSGHSKMTSRNFFCNFQVFHRYFRLCHFVPTTQPLWLVGTSGEKSPILFMGDLAKTTAVGI